MKKYLYLISTLLLLIPSIGFSIPPSISSVTINGSTGTIVGTNFMTHVDHSTSEPYLPVGFENFEDGVITPGTWSVNGTYSVEFNTDLQRAGSTTGARGGGDLRIYTDVFGTTTPSAELPRSFYAPNTEESQVLFMSGWFRFPPDAYDNLMAITGQQSKFLSSLTDTDNYPLESGNQFWLIISGSTLAGIGTNFEDGRGSTSDLYFFESGHTGEEAKPYFTEDEWHRYDIALDTTKGEGLKESRFYIDGKEYTTASNRYYPEDCGANDCPRHFEGSYFIRYLDSAGLPVYFDDAFVNNTWARVEISDNATWDETTRNHLEIQIPTTWELDGTSITFNVNWGSLPDGDYYAYVVNEGNEVNANGYLVTKGDSTDGQPVSIGTGEVISLTAGETATVY